MFRKFNNIDSAFRYVRGFTAAVIFAAAAISCYTVYKSYAAAAKAGERIYVLNNGKVLEALAADRKDNIPVEARDHIQLFHHDFFTLDPDEKVIRNNITRALNLADGSAKRLYENLKESGYYAHIISGNISQEITVDSIRLNLESYPYGFRCFATERIIRATNVTLRSLVTSGQLRNVSRSDNNSHGFLIEKLEVLENRDLKTQDR